MKKYIYHICVLSTLFLASCSGNKDFDQELEESDLKQLQTMRNELETQYQDIESKLKKLDKAIAAKDTTEGKYELVQAKSVVDSAYHHYIALQSSIETQQDANITPEFAGVMNLRVREGQYISKGALIATISDGGLKDQLNQAKIQVDMARSQLNQAEIQSQLAKTTYQKQSQLWDQKIGSEIQYLQAKTNYETSLKGVEMAREQISAAQRGVSGVNAQLQKTNLYAPFSGIVEEVITKSGQVVGPGTPIVRLINSSTLKAVAQVPEQFLEDIKVGTDAIIEIPSINKKIDSKVRLVSSSINPNNRSFKIEVPVSSEGGLIKPNLNAQILLNDYTNDNAIVIPESIIRNSADEQYVFIITQLNSKNMGIAKKVVIETGYSSNGMVEVTSGLNNQDKLIIDAPKKLKEGDKVKIFTP